MWSRRYCLNVRSVSCEDRKREGSHSYSISLLLMVHYCAELRSLPWHDLGSCSSHWTVRWRVRASPNRTVIGPARGMTFLVLSFGWPRWMPLVREGSRTAGSRPPGVVRRLVGRVHTAHQGRPHLQRGSSACVLPAESRMNTIDAPARDLQIDPPALGSTVTCLIHPSPLFH